MAPSPGEPRIFDWMKDRPMQTSQWPASDRRQFVEILRSHLVACGATARGRVAASVFGGLAKYRLWASTAAGPLSITLYPGMDSSDGPGWIAARFVDFRANRATLPDGACRYTGGYCWYGVVDQPLAPQLSAAFRHLAAAGVTPLQRKQVFSAVPA